MTEIAAEHKQKKVCSSEQLLARGGVSYVRFVF